MDDVFPDLMSEIDGIGKKLDNLNADFFTKIFSETLKKELKEHGNHQSEEIKANVQASLQDLKETVDGMQDLLVMQKCYNNDFDDSLYRIKKP